MNNQSKIRDSSGVGAGGESENRTSKNVDLSKIWEKSQKNWAKNFRRF